MSAQQPIQHSNEFQKRRTQNWLVLGLTYAAMYTARYNFSFANKALSDEYGAEDDRAANERQQEEMQAQMVAKGYIAEGYGNPPTVMCAFSSG